MSKMGRTIGLMMGLLVGTLFLFPGMNAYDVGEEYYLNEVDLIAAQHYDVGNIYFQMIANGDGSYSISVQIAIDAEDEGTWSIQAVHIEVANDLDGVPQVNGNAVPGRFEVNQPVEPSATSVDAIIIPMPEGWSPGDELVVAVHAEVLEQDPEGGVVDETAWGEGSGFPGKNWSMYIQLLSYIGLDNEG